MQGLGGLDVGRQLIYRTCQALHNDVPTVHTYLTLSPIPGFLPWLRRCVSLAVERDANFAEAQRDIERSEREGLDGGADSVAERAAAVLDALAVPLELEPTRQPLLERLFYTEEDREKGVLRASAKPSTVACQHPVQQARWECATALLQEL